MIVKYFCPFCKKLIRVEKIIEEDRKKAKICKQNMKIIANELGKKCEFIHN